MNRLSLHTRNVSKPRRVGRRGRSRIGPAPVWFEAETCCLSCREVLVFEVLILEVLVFEGTILLVGFAGGMLVVVLHVEGGCEDGGGVCREDACYDAYEGGYAELWSAIRIDY